MEYPMNPVEYHLKLTIRLWTGAAPSSYSSGSHLRDIWSVPGEAYEPIGIQKFMMLMYSDPLFKSCPAAQNITPNRFYTGGDLQTFHDLYQELLPCGAAGPATSITANIQAVADPAADTAAAKKPAKNK
jgi:hypothetical protein